MDNTCGIFIVDAQNRLLICRSTNSKPENWSIPKGIQDESDVDEWSCACRETIEETGFDIKNRTQHIILLRKLNVEPYNGINYNKTAKKQLNSFLVKFNYELINEELLCTSFFELYDKKFPEIDLFKWVSLNEPILENIHYTQRRLLPSIKLILGL